LKDREKPETTYHFFSNMIAAQAQVMGFRESFLLVAVAFFAAIAPAWSMREKKRVWAPRNRNRR